MIKEIIDMTWEEAEIYIKQIEEIEGRPLKSIKITADGEYANIEYELENQPFERIRRITGYLVGKMNRWNDTKVAEEHDRVKHDVD